jgi:hypothetical protein
MMQSQQTVEQNPVIINTSKTGNAMLADFKRQEKTNKEDDKNQLKQTPGNYLKNKKLVFEQVEGQKFFCSNGEIVSEILDSLNGKDIIYAPFPEEDILWSLCSKTPIKPVNKKKLWKFVRAFIYKHIELPDERLYDVLTAWVFATWIREVWEVVPYVFFLGVKNSGKTRGLEVLQLICYRAKTSVASTAPALFRGIEKYGCVPFIDEAETLNQKDNTDIIACLNAGYRRRGAKVERCQKGEHDNQDLATFDVFGFKAIAGTESLKATLESRSLVINMAKNTRKVEPNINTKAAKSIRNGLLQWRFETLLNNDLSTISEEELTLNDDFDSFDNFDDFDSKTRTSLNIPEELLNIPNGRIVELFTPLFKTTETVCDESVRKIIIDYAKTVAGQQLTEENTSIEADIVLAILDCYSTVENCYVANEVIEAEFNKNRPVRERLEGESLTKRIAALGLKRIRGKTGKRGFEWNSKKLEVLCKRFGFDPELYFKSPLLEASKLSKSSNPSQVTKIGFLLPSQVEHNTVCALCEFKDQTLTYEALMNDERKLKICTRCGDELIEKSAGALL